MRRLRASAHSTCAVAEDAAHCNSRAKRVALVQEEVCESVEALPLGPQRFKTRALQLVRQHDVERHIPALLQLPHHLGLKQVHAV